MGADLLLLVPNTSLKDRKSVGWAMQQAMPILVQGHPQAPGPAELILKKMKINKNHTTQLVFTPRQHRISLVLR